MKRELFSFGRIARVVVVACVFIWLDLYGMPPPRDAASLTCLSIGQLAGLIAVFIPEARTHNQSESEVLSNDDENEIEPG